MAMPGKAPLALDIAIEGIALCRDALRFAYDAGAMNARPRAARSSTRWARSAATRPGRDEVFFSDPGTST